MERQLSFDLSLSSCKFNFPLQQAKMTATMSRKAVTQPQVNSQMNFKNLT